MDNKEFSRQLEGRTKRFAISIIKLSVKLPGSPEGRVIRTQLTKAGTSVGANYREANRARSKADFNNKISICESEASESVYWLEITEEMEWIPSDKISPVLKEANELLALFTSIGNSNKSQ